MGILLLALLVILLMGTFPRWGYNDNWGYGPTSGIGLILVIVLVLVVMGYIPHHFNFG